MNEYFLVQTHTQYLMPMFLIQFAPYDNAQISRQCMITFPNSHNHYVYSVAMSKATKQFVFAGELNYGTNEPFIGVATYINSSAECNATFSYSLQYFKQYQHQEYYVIDIEPAGRYVYAFTNTFLATVDTQNLTNVQIWNGNLTWPNSSFMPNAVDITENFGVIAGFIRNPLISSPKKFIPIIYLINFNSSNNMPVIVDEYIPQSTPGTWQDLLRNSDVDIYSAKYAMSVSINQFGNILVGMQFINRVFYLTVNSTKLNQLIYINRNTNGRSLGNGKAVAWLNNGLAAVLVNTYSLDYQWSTSRLYLYDIKTNGYDSASIPLSIFPNNYQLLPSKFSQIFIYVISSSSSLALLDNDGNILIFTSTLPGYYAFVQDTGLNPIFTSPQACKPGTYKDRLGIQACSLCTNGTKNPGNATIQCIPCSYDSYCTIGAVSDVTKSVLSTKTQIQAYPMSPETTIFDEILIQNMFHIGSNHCLIVSPLFWTLIVGNIAIFIIFIMAILKFCVDHPRGQRIRAQLKRLLKHADLIQEGELWIGGLASCCIIVLVCFAYSFSHKFLHQYPIEKTSDSNFACDLSLRNAKFQTNLKSLSIPSSDDEQKMLDLLNNQTFYMSIDFVNTLIACDALSLQALYGTIWSTIRWLTCSNTNSILSLSVELPYQQTSIQILLDDPQTVGALRVGLYAAGSENERYNLREFDILNSFYINGYILAQNLSILLDITKVINETMALDKDESNFEGIYIPTFVVDLHSLFLTNNQYMRVLTRLTMLTITISETPYYVKNLQQPIAKKSEVIFHNILFTVVCLEIFGLGFLAYKLVIKALCRFIIRQYSSRFGKKIIKKGNNAIINKKVDNTGISYF